MAEVKNYYFTSISSLFSWLDKRYFMKEIELTREELQMAMEIAWDLYMLIDDPETRAIAFSAYVKLLDEWTKG